MNVSRGVWRGCSISLHISGNFNVNFAFQFYSAFPSTSNRLYRCHKPSPKKASSLHNNRRYVNDESRGAEHLHGRYPNSMDQREGHTLHGFGLFATAAAEHIISELPSADCEETIAPWDESQVTNSDEEVIIQHNWHELRLFMWDYVGIVRTDKRLERAMRRIKLLEQEIAEYYAHFRVSNNLLELRNLVTVAELIVRCAMERKESRGLHFNLDHPEQLDDPKPTILLPQKNRLGNEVGLLITEHSFTDLSTS